MTRTTINFLSRAFWLVLLGGACTANAVDVEHLLTFSLKTSAEGIPVERGSTTTGRLFVLRATTRDVIDAVGDDRGIVFGRRAQIVLIRRDAGTDQEVGTFVIREAGQEDVDITSMLGVQLGTPLLYGSVNSATGVVRVRRLSISRVGFDVPTQVTFDLAGVTTEVNNSVRINGMQVNLGLSSFSGRLAGNGAVHGDGPDVPIIVDGTVRLGAPKIISATP